MAGDDAPLDEWDDEAWGHFPVPPPPPPPSLGPVCELQHCRLEGGPMGAHFNKASFPSLPIVAVCSSVVLVAILVASFLLWRHKTKVQNLLPCKNEQPGRLGELGAANGVPYDDVLINSHPTRIPPQGHLTGSQTLMPLEILDIKLGDIVPTQLPTLGHPPCYPVRDHLSAPKSFHPVYEEVSQGPNGPAYGARNFENKLGIRSPASEDDFCEEEFPGSGQCSATSSVRGSTGGDLCRDPVSSDGEDCDFMVHDLPRMMPGQNSFSYSDRRNYPVAPYPDNRTAGKAHSKPDKRHVSPGHAPYGHHVNSRGMPQGGRWRADSMNFPASVSQENIYSTIDEDELSDYPPQSPLTSLACPTRGGSKGAPGTPGRGDRAAPPLSQHSPEENGSSYGDMMPAFHSASFM